MSSESNGVAPVLVVNPVTPRTLAAAQKAKEDQLNASKPSPQKPPQVLPASSPPSNNSSIASASPRNNPSNLSQPSQPSPRSNPIDEPASLPSAPFISNAENEPQSSSSSASSSRSSSSHNVTRKDSILDRIKYSVVTSHAETKLVLFSASESENVAERVSNNNTFREGHIESSSQPLAAEPNNAANAIDIGKSPLPSPKRGSKLNIVVDGNDGQILYEAENQSDNDDEQEDEENAEILEFERQLALQTQQRIENGEIPAPEPVVEAEAVVDENAQPASSAIEPQQELNQEESEKVEEASLIEGNESNSLVQIEQAAKEEQGLEEEQQPEVIEKNPDPIIAPAVEKEEKEEERKPEAAFEQNNEAVAVDANVQNVEVMEIVEQKQEEITVIEQEEEQPIASEQKAEEKQEEIIQQQQHEEAEKEEEAQEEQEQKADDIQVEQQHQSADEIDSNSESQPPMGIEEEQQQPDSSSSPALRPLDNEQDSSSIEPSPQPDSISLAAAAASPNEPEELPSSPKTPSAPAIPSSPLAASELPSAVVMVHENYTPIDTPVAPPLVPSEEPEADANPAPAPVVSEPQPQLELPQPPAMSMDRLRANFANNRTAQIKKPVLDPEPSSSVPENPPVPPAAAATAAPLFPPLNPPPIIQQQQQQQQQPFVDPYSGMMSSFPSSSSIFIPAGVPPPSALLPTPNYSPYPGAPQMGYPYPPYGYPMMNSNPYNNNNNNNPMMQMPMMQMSMGMGNMMGMPMHTNPLLAQQQALAAATATIAAAQFAMQQQQQQPSSMGAMELQKQLAQIESLMKTAIQAQQFMSNPVPAPISAPISAPAPVPAPVLTPRSRRKAKRQLQASESQIPTPLPSSSIPTAPVPATRPAAAAAPAPAPAPHHPNPIRRSSSSPPPATRLLNQHHSSAGSNPNEAPVWDEDKRRKYLSDLAEKRVLEQLKKASPAPPLARKPQQPQQQPQQQQPQPAFEPIVPVDPIAVPAASSAYFHGKARQAVLNAQKEKKMQEEVEKEKKRAMLEKKKQYGALIKQRFLPQIDESKRRESIDRQNGNFQPQPQIPKRHSSLDSDPSHPPQNNSNNNNRSPSVADRLPRIRNPAAQPKQQQLPGPLYPGDMFPRPGDRYESVFSAPPSLETQQGEIMVSSPVPLFSQRSDVALPSIQQPLSSHQQMQARLSLRLGQVRNEPKSQAWIEPEPHQGQGQAQDVQTQKEREKKLTLINKKKQELRKESRQNNNNRDAESESDAVPATAAAAVPDVWMRPAIPKHSHKNSRSAASSLVASPPQGPIAAIAAAPQIPLFASVSMPSSPRQQPTKKDSFFVKKEPSVVVAAPPINSNQLFAEGSYRLPPSKPQQPQSESEPESESYSARRHLSFRASSPPRPSARAAEQLAPLFASLASHRSNNNHSRSGHSSARVSKEEPILAPPAPSIPVAAPAALAPMSYADALQGKSPSLLFDNSKKEQPDSPVRRDSRSNPGGFSLVPQASAAAAAAVGVDEENDELDDKEFNRRKGPFERARLNAANLSILDAHLSSAVVDPPLPPSTRRSSKSLSIVQPPPPPAPVQAQPQQLLQAEEVQSPQSASNRYSEDFDEYNDDFEDVEEQPLQPIPVPRIEPPSGPSTARSSMRSPTYAEIVASPTRPQQPALVLAPPSPNGSMSSSSAVAALVPPSALSKFNSPQEVQKILQEYPDYFATPPLPSRRLSANPILPPPNEDIESGDDQQQQQHHHDDADDESYLNEPPKPFLRRRKDPIRFNPILEKQRREAEEEAKWLAINQAKQPQPKKSPNRPLPSSVVSPAVPAPARLAAAPAAQQKQSRLPVAPAPSSSHLAKKPVKAQSAAPIARQVSVKEIEKDAVEDDLLVDEIKAKIALLNKMHSPRAENNGKKPRPPGKR